jgi:hypothetical protein
MSSLAQAKKAIKMFKHPLATKKQYHHNVRQWLRSVETLGDSWLLAKSIPRKIAS